MGIEPRVAEGKSTAFTMCTIELQTLLSAPPEITVALFAAPIKVTVVCLKFHNYIVRSYSHVVRAPVKIDAIRIIYDTIKVLHVAAEIVPNDRLMDTVELSLILKIASTNLSIHFYSEIWVED